MLWSSEVWQNSAYNIQRTIQNIVLFTRVVSEWVSDKGGLSNTLKLGRFIWGCVNYENNSVQLRVTKVTRGQVNPTFFDVDQRLLWHECIKNLKKENYLKKWTELTSWYLRAIEVKCVSMRNWFRYSTLVCMTPRLKLKNENQNRLELLNKRRKLARAADILDGKDFQI